MNNATELPMKLSFLKNLYYIISNTIILLVIIEFGLHIFFKQKYLPHDIDFYNNLPQVVKSAYPQFSPDEINRLLKETWAGGWTYDEWVGFKEKERNGKFVNVNQFGIRSNGNGDLSMKELNGAIWMFGGSTTFGYGVADWETIPAVLENTLRHKVVNFGRGFFYSAQENLLLKNILTAGYSPSKVIFLDGINERCSIDVYQEEMKLLFQKSQNPYPVSLLDSLGSIEFWLNNLRQNRTNPKKAALFSPECRAYGSSQPFVNVHGAAMREREQICSAYKLDCQTFVQPFAGLHGTHEDYRNLPAEKRELLKGTFDTLKENWMAYHAVFIIDALDNKKSHSFVDDVHYSAEANALIAKEIAKNLQ